MSKVIKIASYGGLGFIVGHLAGESGHHVSSWEYWAFLVPTFLLASLIDLIE